MPPMPFDSRSKSKLREYRTEEGAQIDGIIYPSSKTGQKAIVIFADSLACIDAEDATEQRTLLRLDKAVDVSLEGYAAGTDHEIFRP